MWNCFSNPHKTAAEIGLEKVSASIEPSDGQYLPDLGQNLDQPLQELFSLWLGFQEAPQRFEYLFRTGVLVFEKILKILVESFEGIELRKESFRVWPWCMIGSLRKFCLAVQGLAGSLLHDRCGKLWLLSRPRRPMETCWNFVFHLSGTSRMKFTFS